MDANPDRQKMPFLAQLQLAASFLTRLPIGDRSAVPDDLTEEDRPDYAPQPGVLADAIWLFLISALFLQESARCGRRGEGGDLEANWIKLKKKVHDERQNFSRPILSHHYIAT